MATKHKMKAAHNALKRMRQRFQGIPNSRPAKMEAALKALTRMQHSSGATQLPAKILAAREALERLSTVQPSCTTKVDRFEIGCTGLDMAGISRLEGYQRTRSHWLKPKSPTDFVPYRRVTAFRNVKSSGQILVYSDRKSPKLRPYRVTFIPDDQLGLRPEDALAVVDCAEQHRVSKVELAFDFPSGSSIDCALVRRHALFGKSREYSVGKRPGWDAWGSRQGAKFVRSYYKKEVGAHRVELQLQLPFLRQHGINEISDLPRLLKILPRDHIWFARLSEQKLTRAMHKSGISQNKMQEIRNAVGSRAGNLWDALRFLRRQENFRNVRRLLVPLHVNQAVSEALKAWAAEWQLRSTRPKKKP
jgi:hypothetical protein